MWVKSGSRFSSVAQSCHTLCNPMNCSTPGLPVTNSWSLPKLMSIESMMTSNHSHPLSSPSLPASIFPKSQLFTSGGQNTGVSALTSVLPMNTQDRFPLEWTGWISLQSKGHSRVFSTPQFKSINSSVLSFLYSPTLTTIHDHWKNHNLD